MPFYPVGPSVFIVSWCKENEDLRQLVAEVREICYYIKLYAIEQNKRLYACRLIIVH